MGNLNPNGETQWGTLKWIHNGEPYRGTPTSLGNPKRESQWGTPTSKENPKREPQWGTLKGNPTENPNGEPQQRTPMGTPTPMGTLSINGEP